VLSLTALKIKGYEKVVMARDPAAKFRAVIAVHNTFRGPSLGGVRMFPYRSEAKAIQDAVRLSKAMSYKAAVSGLKLGGGKAVLIGNPAKDKTRELFLALGDFIERLKGIYIAAEDSGIAPEDLDIMAERTRHVTGASIRLGGSGDPSPGTARGILKGIQTCLSEVYGRPGLKGTTVALQGVGQVGLELAKLLDRKGARLIIADLSAERLRRARKLFSFREAAPGEIHRVPADVFSPCGLGGVLHPKTIRELRAKIVAGGANNQFIDEQRDARLLFRRGILHAPDYVINAGGLIQLYVRELLKKKDITPWIERIDATLRKIFTLSRREKLPPLWIAHRLAAAGLKRKKSA
jgi:leucine dehydrogenase